MCVGVWVWWVVGVMVVVVCGWVGGWVGVMHVRVEEKWPQKLRH